MDKLISIIIPVYKQERELQMALRSIREQTYKNVEIIIERDELHEGAPVMRNRGLAKAKGDYVIFWDADVVAEPEMLRKMFNVLDHDSYNSFVYCNFRQITFNFFDLVKVYKNIPARDFDGEFLRKNNYIHSTTLIKRSVMINWDENLKRFQDWDLWLTLSEKGKTGAWINEYLFKIVGRGTISSWLPRLAYKKPWKYLPGFKQKVLKYEEARKVIILKHLLND